MKSLARLLLVIVLCVIGQGFINAQTYIYQGKVGQYDVKMTLTPYDSDSAQGFGSRNYYRGKYTYIKAGNSLKLDGYDWTMTGMTVLEEYTPKGKHSGTWELKGFVGDDDLTGIFTNLSTGKEFHVYLIRKRQQ